MLAFEQAAMSRKQGHAPAEARYRVPRPRLLLVRDSAASTAAAAADGEPDSSSSAERADWCVVHERLVRLGAERARHEHELCRALRAAERLAVHTHTGHGSLAEYAERLLGLRPRQVEERLRVARALERLPLLDGALGSGTLAWSAVRELTRVAVPETEEAWLRWARGRRARHIEQAVASRRPGDRPETRPDPSLVKHRLRFEVRAETMALFRELQARIRAELGSQVDDDTFLYELARRALGGPADEGRASYQVAVTRCPDCGRASIEAGGQSHPVSEAISAMIACDCQELGCMDAWPSVAGAAVAAAAAPASTTPQTQHATGAPEGASDGGQRGRPATAAAGQTPQTHVGAEEARDERKRDRLAAPVAVAAATATAARPPETHVGAGEPPRTLGHAPPPPARPRATQSIPPAVRRLVKRRDGSKCTVPGCSAHRYLDLHHLDPRAEGGTHDPDRMLSLCGAHHRAVHAGSLVITGTASTGLVYRHADGTPYGGPLRPEAVAVAEQAFGALRKLGFPETRARALLDQALERAPAGELAPLLEQALRLA